VRTLFNLLGPLCNPAGATRQLLGVYDPARCEQLARALGELGSTRALVVHGFAAGVAADERASAGIDDASIEGETLVWELRDGEVTRRIVHPRDAGLEPASLAALGERLVDLGPATNAEALLELLEGSPGPYRTAVQWSGALALLAAGDDDWSALRGHAERIGEVLDDGRARSKLADLAATSEQWSPARGRAMNHSPELRR
jgi:anthranilate phosphoribosyltransferase